MKEIITKTKTFHERKSSCYEIFGWRKRWYYGFLGVKEDFALTQEVGRKVFPQKLQSAISLLWNISNYV